MWKRRSSLVVTRWWLSRLSCRMRWSAPNRVSRRGSLRVPAPLRNSGPCSRRPMHRRTASALSVSSVMRVVVPRRRIVRLVFGGRPVTSSMSSARASPSLSPSATSSATSASSRGSRAAASAGTRQQPVTTVAPSGSGFPTMRSAGAPRRAGSCDVAFWSIAKSKNDDNADHLRRSVDGLSPAASRAAAKATTGRGRHGERSTGACAPRAERVQVGEIRRLGVRATLTLDPCLRQPTLRCGVALGPALVAMR